MVKGARTIAVLWVVVVGYWALRIIQLSDEHCPDKIWESVPKECEGSLFDLITWFGVPLTVLAPAAWLIGGLGRLRRRGRRGLPFAGERRVDAPALVLQSAVESPVALAGTAVRLDDLQLVQNPEREIEHPRG